MLDLVQKRVLSRPAAWAVGARVGQVAERSSRATRVEDAIHASCATHRTPRTDWVEVGIEVG
ncbi:hypothetical protein ACSRUE_32755 [Sorangium sp. KYC3313]